MARHKRGPKVQRWRGLKHSNRGSSGRYLVKGFGKRISYDDPVRGSTRQELHRDLRRQMEDV